MKYERLTKKELVAEFRKFQQEIATRQKSEKIQTSLYRISEAAHLATSLEGLFPKIHQIISQLMDAANFYIALIDQTGEMLEFPYFVDEFEEPPAPNKLGKGLTEYVLHTGKPLLATPRVFRSLLRKNEVEDVGAPSLDWLGVPLRIEDKIIGVLVVQSYQKGVRYGEEEKNLLRFVSDQVAMAIERKRAEDALRLNEKRLRQIIDLVPHFIFAKDITGRFILVNQAVADAYGTSVEELTGKTDADFAKSAAEARHFRTDDMQVIKSGRPKLVPEEPITFAGGQVRLLQTTKIPFAFSGSGTPAVLGVSVDITERKRAEEDLRRSESTYRALLNSVPDLMFRIDRQGRFLDFKAGMKEDLFAAPQDFLGKSATEILPAPIAEMTMTHIDTVLQTGEIQVFEYSLPINGVDNVFEARLSVSGENEVLAIVRNITERKQSEEILKKSEERFRALVHQSYDVIFITDDKGRIKLVTPSATRMFGTAEEDIIGKTGFELMHPDDRKKAILSFTEVVEKRNRGIPTEFRVRRGDGSYIHVEVIGNNLLDHPEVRGIVLTARDISERKRAEESIRESENKYRLLFEESKDMIFFTSPDGKFLDINPAGVTLLGYDSREEIMKVDVSDTYFHKKTRKQFQAIMNRDGFVRDFEVLLKRKDGEVITVLITSTGIRDDAGNITAYRGVIHDITQRRHLEQQLFQAQKLESIGTMAGGIAHDFNNILGGILGYASFMKTKIETGNPFYTYVDTIERGAKRASELTSQLLAFARGGPFNLKPVNINTVVEEIITIITRTFEKSIEIHQKLTSGLPLVEADAGQIQQVLMNLLVNSRDAMPGGGRLTIATEQRRLSKDEIQTDIEAHQGEYVVIIVSDTGMGIEKEVLSRIFEPFFSTKDKSKGTGLGLSIVYGVVKNHGGFVRVASEIGRGTTFTVFLPTTGKSPKAVSESIEERDLSGKELILVVDDEADIRYFVRDILLEYGYRVLLAEDGQQAIDLYRQQPDAIDLVILDMMMPRLGGKETFQRLQQINPEVKALLSTGYSQNEMVQEVLTAGAEGFIQKPYRASELLQRLRLIFDS